MNAPTSPDEVRALAHSLGCATEGELCALADISPGTAKNWRKRGHGPAYVLLGNAYLYPRKGLRAFIAARVRERPIPVKGLL
jgi:hypothetical protein